jgi:hypothetical protein
MSAAVAYTYAPDFGILLKIGGPVERGVMRAEADDRSS